MLTCNSSKPIGRKLVLAFQCFIDESADGFGNHTIVMAGYVAEEAVWSKFNADWNIEVENQYKTGFATFTKKIFKHKKATKNAEKFYRIIEKHLDKAFCITCSVPEYKGLIARCRFPNSLAESPQYSLFQSEPHVMLYRAFMDLCYYEREKLEIKEPVDLIFDETEKYEGWILSVFDYLYYSASKLGLEPSLFGKKPIFMDDESTPALQAADLLARIIRHNLVQGEEATKMPWEKKKEMKHLIADMGENYVLQIFDSSFSEENSRIYQEYAKARHYRFYDFLYRFFKCFPAFIRVPIFRILNKPLLLG